jgi:hypothetical protein
MVGIWYWWGACILELNKYMKENDLLNKLLRVERTLSEYDDKSKDLLQELEVNIPLDKLKLIVVSKDGDDQLYLPYVLDELQLKKITEMMDITLLPDFNKNYYVLDCIGIYDW